LGSRSRPRKVRLAATKFHSFWRLPLHLWRFLPYRDSKWLRQGLALVVVLSLVASDLAAASHVGACCAGGQISGCESGPRSDAFLAGQGECGHGDCCRVNPFSRIKTGESRTSDSAGDRVGGEASGGSGGSSHDRDTCPLCRWFTTASAAVWFVSPNLPEIGISLTRPVWAAESQTVVALFLPTLSRRGPPSIV
jgi:hypothetical protein